MPIYRILSSRVLSSMLFVSAAAAIFGSLGASESAHAATACANGTGPLVLEWSEGQNPSNGAVWSKSTNTYDLGEDLFVTGSLIDIGALDTPSTLTNSDLLAEASPDQGGSLIWNLDTTDFDQQANSTLLFEFSRPVESFSIVITDVDAKAADGSDVGWHDQVTGVVEGEETSLSVAAADPTLVTVEGPSAWAADDTAKTANESPAGNVRISATGTIFSAGVTYSDGPRTGTAPERHAVGVSSLHLCLAQSGTASTTTTATTTTATTTTPTTTTPTNRKSSPGTSSANTTTTSTTPIDTTFTGTTPANTTAARSKTNSATPSGASPDGSGPNDLTFTGTTEAGASATTANSIAARIRDDADDSATEPSYQGEKTPTPDGAATKPQGATGQSDLAVSLEATEPVSYGSGLHTFVYSLTATNNSAGNLDSVQLFYDLRNSLSDAKSWQVHDISTSSGCFASDAFDGGASNELLSPEVDLASGESCTVEIPVTVEPGTASRQFLTSATGSGFDGLSQRMTSSTDPASVSVSAATQTLALTGTEAEDLAALGALLFILGAVLTGYRERFLLRV